MSLNVSRLNEKKINEILNKKYVLSCNSIVRMPNGSANLFHVSSNNGDYVLKEFQDGFDINRVEREIKITELVQNGGIPTTDFIYNCDRQAYLVYDGNIITLQRFIDGITKDYNSLTEEQCMEAANYYSKIISILKNNDIKLPNFKMNIFEISKISESIDKCSQLIEMCKDEDMINALKDKRRMLVEACNMDFHYAKDLTFVNSHGDYNTSQFIYDEEGKIKAILDFASAKSLPIVWELLRSFIFMDSTYDNGKFSLDGFINYLKTFNKNEVLNKYDIEYMFKVYYMFLLNSMFGFEQYMKNNNNEYYAIGMNLYYQSKYLNQNMDELTKVLKKRMMEVL